jgi:MFS family permease
MVGLGNLIGPLIGAAFAEKLTWRGLFYLLCPIGVIGLVADYFLLPSTMPKEDFKGNLKKIDFLGVLSASAAIILLLIPISGGGSYFEWNSPMVIAMLSTGGCLAIAFVIIEWKVAKLPMMPCKSPGFFWG